MKRVEASRQWYLIKWADGDTQEQEVIHMYGRLTKQRPLRTGDKVLALAQTRKCVHQTPTYTAGTGIIYSCTGSGAFMPGEIQGVLSGQLVVEFCDGKQ